MAASRKYLGADIGYGVRLRVYLREDALEVEEASLTVLDRRRVFFDDVLLLTFHRERGVAGLVVLGLLAAIFGLMMVSMLDSRDSMAAIGPGIWFAAFSLSFLLRISLGTDVITVYGRRTMARLKFFWRKGRARRIFEELAVKIEKRQVEAARAQAAAAPKPPPPTLPPAPPPGPAGT